MSEIKELSEDFLLECLNHAEEKFKGHFVRIDKQNFIAGCAYGYGAAMADTKKPQAEVKELREALREALTYVQDEIAREEFKKLLGDVK